MHIYNTLSRTKEPFTPLNPPHVAIYSCGPTVYNYVHIGNLRTFIFEDILRRYLKYKQYKTTQIKNLTDVDDKTIRDSKKAGMSLKAFTEKYTQAFFEDTDALNIERAEAYPKATEHIQEMVAMIKTLLEKGLAYKADDGVYYSIKKFNTYGEFAHINVEELQAGASGRVQADEYDKEHVADFSLWKYWDEADGDVYWETELGKGRPGWHIECSAMSAKHLTDLFKNTHVNPDGFQTLDIHTGGVDLIFPHHQDEIAQTEGCVDKKFVKYWMHGEHLLVDGKKMSKSLGNFYTLRDLLSKGHNPLAFRFLVLNTHYRQKLNFTFDALGAATTGLQRIHDFIIRLDEIKQTGAVSNDVQQLITQTQHTFERGMDDDLHISPGLAALFDFMNTINERIEKNTLTQQEAEASKDLVKRIDRVLGILPPEHALSDKAQALLQEREEARKNKQWNKSDELRDKLKELGIAVEDTPHGQRWKRIL